MKDINKLIDDKFKDKEFELQYYSSETYARLADELLLLRKKRGVTQKELAEMMGTTQAVISRLENATVKASLETVVKIAEALHAIVDIRLRTQEEFRKKEMVDVRRKIIKIKAPSSIFNNPPLLTKDAYSKLINFSSSKTDTQLARWC
jgi:transcriptional regulator with XRE-family HTH domain